MPPAIGLGQEHEDFLHYKSKYPEALGIYLQRKEDVVIRVSSQGELDIESEVVEERMLLDETANMFSEDQIGYSDSFTQIEGIEAYTLQPVKRKKYDRLDVEEIKTLDASSAGIFHDDLKRKSFLFPGLVKGAKTHLSYRERLLEPHLYGAYYFGSNLPVESSMYSVSFPESVHISYLERNMEKAQVEVNETVSDGIKTITWTVSNLDPIRGEPNAPSFRYFEPHLIVWIDSWTYNGNKQELLSGPEALHDWYTTLLNMRERNRDMQLNSVVLELTEGVESEYEKVKRIYYWVQENVKYVAFEDGLGGFVPRDPYTVFEKRYGDCKDMASIINEMLAVAGIESYFTWIGTRDIPYAYTEVPTPQSDNHMICTWKDGDVPYFLDATGPYYPMDLPTSHIQGKQALLHQYDTYEILEVPVPEPTRNQQRDSVWLTFDGDVLNGTGKLHLSGYPKVHTTMRLLGRKEEDRWKFFKRYLQRGNNKFFLDSATTKNLGDRDKQLEVDYKFHIENYALQNNDELYINPHLNRDFADNKIEDEKRTVPVEWDFKRSVFETAYIAVPDGYSVDYLPEAVKQGNERFGFELNYALEGNQIRIDQAVFINLLLLQPEDFGEWNAMLKELSRAYKEIIVLKKV